MIVVWIFLAVPWVCLQFVVFLDHTRLLFLMKTGKYGKEHNIFRVHFKISEKEIVQSISKLKAGKV